MQNFVFRDSNLDLNNTQKYSLSIQADLDGFSFVIRQKENGIIKNIYSETFTLSNTGVLVKKIHELLDENQLTNGNFSEVQIFIPGYFPTLFAEDFSHEKDIRNFLLDKKYVKNRNRTVCQASVLPGYQLGWLIDSLLKQAFNDLYPEAEFRHYVVPMFQYFQQLHLTEEFDWHCYITDKEVYFTRFNNGQVVFFNGYLCPSESDILYYLLAVTKISGFKIARINVYGQKNRSEFLLKNCQEFGLQADYHHPKPNVQAQAFFSRDIPCRVFPLLI